MTKHQLPVSLRRALTWRRSCPRTILNLRLRWFVLTQKYYHHRHRLLLLVLTAWPISKPTSFPGKIHWHGLVPTPIISIVMRFPVRRAMNWRRFTSVPLRSIRWTTPFAPWSAVVSDLRDSVSLSIHFGTCGSAPIITGNQVLLELRNRVLSLYQTVGGHDDEFEDMDDLGRDHSSRQLPSCRWGVVGVTASSRKCIDSDLCSYTCSN